MPFAQARAGMRRRLGPVGRVAVRAEAGIGAREIGLVQRGQHLRALVRLHAQRGLVVQKGLWTRPAPSVSAQHGKIDVVAAGPEIGRADVEQELGPVRVQRALAQHQQAPAVLHVLVQRSPPAPRSARARR